MDTIDTGKKQYILKEKRLIHQVKIVNLVRQIKFLSLPTLLLIMKI